MASNDHSASFSVPAFQSRFLKTDKSAALAQSQQLAEQEKQNAGLRSMRSTFSPLAKLPENVAVQNGTDGRLSREIANFMHRTDRVASEWKNLGQDKSGSPVKRGGSVDREPGLGSGDRSWSVIRSQPHHSSSLSHSVRASSLAPPSIMPQWEIWPHFDSV